MSANGGGGDQEEGYLSLSSFEERAIEQALAKAMEPDPSIERELKFVREVAGYTLDGIPFGGSRMTRLLAEDKGWLPAHVPETNYDPVTNRVLTANYVANLFHSHPVARNIINNYTFFTFGNGFPTTLPDDASDEEKQALEDWTDENCWLDFQEQVVRDKSTFGYNLAVMYPLTKGRGGARTADCEYVRSIPDARVKKVIQSKEDHATILGYEVEGFNDLLNPVDVVPFSMSTLGTNPRGASVISPAFEELVFIRKFVKGRFYLNETRARLPVVRRVHSQKQANAEKSIWSTRNLPSYGQVVIDGKTNEWIFPSLNIDSAGAKEDFRMLVLMIAAAVSLPEYLVLQDASNNNFSSLIVAEGPTHKMFKSIQRRDAKKFQRIVRAAGFESAVVESPTILPRVYKDEAQGLAIAKGAGFISEQTGSERLGHDWTVEVERMAQHEQGTLFPDNED